jgi:glycosyltransferase involved in cell wall biosynthesis
MRIIQAHNRYQQPGGEDQVAAAEAALLRSHGDEVIPFERENTAIQGRGSLGLSARAVWSRTSYREMDELIRKTRPDVLHCHNTQPLISPSIYYAAHRHGVPVVQSLHNYRLLCPNALFFREGRPCELCLHRTWSWPGVRHACYRGSRAASAVVGLSVGIHRVGGTWARKVARFIALSEFSKRKFIEGGLPEERMVVKPNFIFPDPGVGPRKGSSFFYIGRLSAEKGLNTLIDAWRDSCPDVPLDIAGDGPLRDDVQRAEQAIPGLRWLGHLPREQVIERLKNAYAFVFPTSCYENFPMVIAEAFACGVPVLCGTQGVAGELVRDGVTGLHFRTGCVADLGRKVRWALDHREHLLLMASAARTEFESKYTAEENYRWLLAIYDEALESTRRN